jgi:hypothetical protein
MLLDVELGVLRPKTSSKSATPILVVGKYLGPVPMVCFGCTQSTSVAELKCGFSVSDTSHRRGSAKIIHLKNVLNSPQRKK